jgi:hypothetical protein
MLKCLISVLIYHEMFGILEAAMVTTTHREKNGSTRQCSVAKKDIFCLLKIYSYLREA